MQTASRKSEVVSTPALLIVGLVLAGAVGVAAIGPAVVGGRSPAPSAPLLAERSLSFTDRADHAVVATEGGTQVAVFEGEQGFLRGTLRGLARSRKAAGIDHAAPFHLAAYADGRLTLDDPKTGQRIDLEAFGPTNEAVFARLLPLAETRK